MGYQFFSRIFTSIRGKRCFFGIGGEGHKERGVRNMKGAGRMRDHPRWEHQRRLPEQVVLKADGERQEGGVQHGEMEGSIPVRGDIGWRAQIWGPV